MKEHVTLIAVLFAKYYPVSDRHIWIFYCITELVFRTYRS